MSTYSTSTARSILGTYFEVARDMFDKSWSAEGLWVCELTGQECTCSMERSKDNLAGAHTSLGAEPGAGPWLRGGWHQLCWRGLLDATSHRGALLWSSSNMSPETSGASRLLCCCKWWCCLHAGWSNEKFSWCQPQTFFENVGSMLCYVQGNGVVTGWVRKPFLPWCQTLTAYACGVPEDQAHAFMGMLSRNLEWKQWRGLQSYHSF